MWLFYKALKGFWYAALLWTIQTSQVIWVGLCSFSDPYTLIAPQPKEPEKLYKS